jgi:hypothetical protein
MELFAQFVAWQNYANTEFVQAEIAEERALSHQKHVEAVAMLTLNPQVGKVTVARAEQAASPEVERARQNYLNAYAQRKMTQLVMDNCERCAALVSRELTRRVGREPLERRQMRWNP